MRLHHVVVGTLLTIAMGGCAQRDARAPLPLMVSPASALLATPPAAALDPARIPAGDYVQANQDGHLILNGQRIRFWGAIGGLPSTWPDLKPTDTPEQKAAKVKAAYADTEALVQRLVDLGFNLNRTWHGVPVSQDYVPGDGSRADIIDHFYATMKRRGLHLWGAGINDFGKITAADVGIVADAGSAAEWQAAVGKEGVDVWNIARKWDPRMEAMAIKRRAELTLHLNRHTGLRYADDPVFAAWELSNEEWWISKMVGGAWRGLPPYWQKTLTQRWNAFLVARYKNDAGLAAHWKSLLPGESLARGTVQILPLANPQDLSQVAVDETGKKALLAAQANADQKYSRSDFATARGEDVLAFFSDLHLSSKQREAAAFKRLGRSTALSPLAYDTGIGYEIQAQWLHQNADFSSHDAYINGVGWNNKKHEATTCAQCQRLNDVSDEAVAANTGPWNNWLLKPPGIAQGVPWLEHNKVPGKPYMAYETQIQQPAKYRADYPLRLAALASIQDWDGVAWHYFAPPAGVADPNNWHAPMDNTVGHHPQGYHYTFDEVQNAQMHAAALMWRQNLLPAPAKPTTFIYGRKSLQDPESMDYGHSYGRRGLDMMYTTYQYGVRVLIDPTREDDEVRGPSVSFDDRRRHNPYTPTKEITFDWKQGHIRIDAPGAVGFAGLLPKVGGAVTFTNGLTLSGIDINNPTGIYDPVTNEEGYIAFTLVSEDGKPLAESRSACLALNSTSFNTGFALGKGNFEKSGATSSPLYASAPENSQNGTLPVLVARVAGTISGKALAGFSWVAYDWTMKPIATGAVAGETLRVPNNLPIFYMRLTRTP